MKVEVPTGKYVLAVSGGVDSMVLLDSMANLEGITLVVAHFNHGIREDCHKDEELVVKRAKELNLPFEVGYGHLGVGASEAQAREARYKFLGQVKKQYKTTAIITAHHQDDRIETAFINLLRGTNYRGLVAISTNRNVIRPLMSVTKQEIIDYAKLNNIEWREDASNRDDIYLRNRLRKSLCGLSVKDRSAIISNLDKVANISTLISKVIAKHSQNNYIDRAGFISLPTEVANELVAANLRHVGLTDYDKLTINRLNMTIRTAKSKTVFPVRAGLKLEISQKSAQLVPIC